jgi:putative ABC transport system substrate-binding protein
MDRRTFVGIATGALVVAPFGSSGQSITKARRIGILTAGTSASLPATFFTALRELGWVEGGNLVIERRGADGRADRVPALAAELVQLRVDAIVTFGAVAGLAAKQATAIIPIAAVTGDPVAFGLVSSMSHPGGNITGIALVSPQLAAKRLELLRELLPGAVRIGELVEPNNTYWHAVRADYERAFRSLSMEPMFVFVTSPETIDTAIADLTRRRVDALVVRGDPLFLSNREQIARLAVKHKLVTIAEERPFVEAGALVSYGPVVPVLTHRLAVLVDKILKGAAPGDLPIEQPSRFELVINLKTARALGLTIPQSLLLRADEVIQ